MKRLQHYNKELAIVLSVFGSSEPDALDQYTQLLDELKNSISTDIEVRIAISSRTVLKNLEKLNKQYYTLPEQLANLDRIGYKKVVVASINVFPTIEHDYILQIVDAFRKTISIANYEVTMPLFTTTTITNSFLKSLNDDVRKNTPDANIIFVGHGTRTINSTGNQVFTYVRDYLKILNTKNYFYTLEGAFPYDKDLFLDEAKRNTNILANEKAIVVPLLLVNGNHSINDISEIRQDISKNMEIIDNNENISLLKSSIVKEYFIDQVKNSINKLNW